MDENSIEYSVVSTPAAGMQITRFAPEGSSQFVFVLQ